MNYTLDYSVIIATKRVLLQLFPSTQSPFLPAAGAKNCNYLQKFIISVEIWKETSDPPKNRLDLAQVNVGLQLGVLKCFFLISRLRTSVFTVLRKNNTIG